jgi:uncharacterized protein
MDEMPVQVSYPCVYVQEIPSGVRTVTGISTSVAMFIGMTKRGRLNAPTRVLGLTDYECAFGTDTAISEMTDHARQFLLILVSKPSSHGLQRGLGWPPSS